MIKKILSPTLLCVTMMMTSMQLLAQDSDGVPDVAITTASPFIRPLEASPAGLAKIYSNFGSRTDAYDDKLGWAVAGPDSKLGKEQWIAMPFTPKTDATVMQIKIPVGWDGLGYGANGFTLTINSGSTTLPGKVLHQWALQNLFSWGTCCSVDVANNKQGIKIKKGQHYWIVAKTGSTTAQTIDVWAYTWNHVMGSISYNLGQGWKPYPNQVLPAVAVYGTKP